MRRVLFPCLVVIGIVMGWHGAPAESAPATRASIAPGPSVIAAFEADPDVPAGIAGAFDKAEILRLRELYLARRMSSGDGDALHARLDAIARMKLQVGRQVPFTASSHWEPVGPAPIPNGQTTAISTSVSGRITAIVVHPTNPDIVYIGAALGGVWRTLDGGANWTPIFDTAASLAIGSLALAPSDPSILYVGTGEANFGSGFFGVGLYRIEDPAGAAVLHGPFDPVPTTDVIGAHTFTGRSISRILVDPNDPAIVFVSTGSGRGGVGAEFLDAAPPAMAIRGIYRSTNATSENPDFAKLTVLRQASIPPDTTGDRIVNDMEYDPADPSYNTIVCWVLGTSVLLDGGIWRTTDAKAAHPTFTQTFSTTTNSARGAFAVTRAGGSTLMLVATGELANGTGCTTANGCLRRSLDGGVSWSAKLFGGGGFCGQQCFYDIPIALSPTDPDVILIGGSANGTCSRVFARSTDGGATFSAPGSADAGLHADAHAIAFAPSDPSIVYEANDGGIYKSLDGGASWASLNSGVSATQFYSVATHPLDGLFTLGGTQDNGTNWLQPGGSWFRADYGDGGAVVIDQNATDMTNVRMYHTYFTLRASLVAYVRATNTSRATDGQWEMVGNGANGIALTEYCDYLAPLVRGPGTPFNTIYFATDRLHRSVDGGSTNPTVSQAPINGVGVPITAVAIAASDDSIRLVATSNTNVVSGGSVNVRIMGTVTGSNVLQDWTSPAMPLSKYVARVAIDPTNPDIAYVCFGGFGIPDGHHLWKTSNLRTGSPTWVPSGSGLPDVPLNALEVDSQEPSRLWAGTDIGVFASEDGGLSWSPYTTGMPVVAVFGMSLQPSQRILRIATYGRGIWDRAVDPSTATVVTLVGSEIVEGHPRLTWYSPDGANESMSLYRRPVPGGWEPAGTITADPNGLLRWTDLAALPGRSYEYRIGIPTPSGEQFFGQVWVDLPDSPRFALRLLAGNDTGRLRFGVELPGAGAARLDLVDVTGRRVASQHFTVPASGARELLFDTASIPPGVYWATLIQASRQISARAIVTR